MIVSFLLVDCANVLGRCFHFKERETKFYRDEFVIKLDRILFPTNYKKTYIEDLGLFFDRERSSNSILYNL